MPLSVWKRVAHSTKHEAFAGPSVLLLVAPLVAVRTQRSNHPAGFAPQPGGLVAPVGSRTYVWFFYDMRVVAGWLPSTSTRVPERVTATPHTLMLQPTVYQKIYTSHQFSDM